MMTACGDLLPDIFLPMPKIKRHSFSLTELLTVLMLLGTMIAVPGVRGYELIEKIRFRKDVEKMKGRLQTAYDLVLRYDVDIHISLEQTDRGLFCRLLSDHPSLLNGPEKEVFFSRLRKLEKDGRNTSTVFCTFSYFGGHQPIFFLSLSNGKKETVSFEIRGFPHVIKAKTSLFFTS